MVSKTQKLAFLNLLFLIFLQGCRETSPTKFSALEIIQIESGKVLKTINDNNQISDFEQNVKSGKKIELLKNPNNFPLIIKGKALNMDDELFIIKGDTVKCKNGLFKCDRRFSDILTLNVNVSD